jgi:hypothetical protein
MLSNLFKKNVKSLPGEISNNHALGTVIAENENTRYRIEDVISNINERERRFSSVYKVRRLNDHKM